MQPPAPSPPPFPSPYVPGPPLPPAKRGYGIVVMVGAVVWGLGVLAGLIGFWLAMGTIISSVESAAASGADDVSEWLPMTESVTVLVVTALFVVVTTVLDLVAVVQSVRRLVGRIGDAFVPWTVIVAIALAWISPVPGIVLLVIGFAVESPEMIVIAIALLMLALYLVLPTCRLTQLVAGIVRTAMGERPRAG